VIIPAANAEDLMLREDVIDAMRAGSFRVVTIEHVDDLVQLMFGIPAGARNEEGKFPEDSVHARVEVALKEISERLDGQRKRGRDDKDEKDDGEGKEPAPAEPPEPPTPPEPTPPIPPEPPPGPPEPPQPPEPLPEPPEPLPEPPPAVPPVHESAPQPAAVSPAMPTGPSTITGSSMPSGPRSCS
jgi:hypothetical protein